MKACNCTCLRVCYSCLYGCNTFISIFLDCPHSLWGRWFCNTPGSKYISKGATIKLGFFYFSKWNWRFDLFAIFYSKHIQIQSLLLWKSGELTSTEEILNWHWCRVLSLRAVALVESISSFFEGEIGTDVLVAPALQIPTCFCIELHLFGNRNQMKYTLSCFVLVQEGPCPRLVARYKIAYKLLLYSRARALRICLQIVQNLCHLAQNFIATYYQIRLKRSFVERAFHISNNQYGRPIRPWLNGGKYTNVYNPWTNYVNWTVQW